MPCHPRQIQIQKHHARFFIALTLLRTLILSHRFQQFLTGSEGWSISALASLSLRQRDYLQPAEGILAFHLFRKSFFRKIVELLRKRGNIIIVGRGANCILKDEPDVLRVRLIAPLSNFQY